MTHDLTPPVQPLGQRERRVRERGLALFEAFRQAHREAHDRARACRRLRTLRDDALPAAALRLATLNSTVDNVVADQMDAMPEPLMLPERPDLQRSADLLTDVIGYALYHSAFDEQYARLMEDCAVAGTGILQVYWDPRMDDGRGMVRVERWPMEGFFPDPLFDDVQQGRAIFKTAFYPASGTASTTPTSNPSSAPTPIGSPATATPLRTSPRAPDRILVSRAQPQNRQVRAAHGPDRRRRAALLLRRTHLRARQLPPSSSSDTATGTTPPSAPASSRTAPNSGALPAATPATSTKTPAPPAASASSTARTPAWTARPWPIGPATSSARAAPSARTRCAPSRPPRSTLRS